MYAILFVVFIVGGTALLSWPLGRYMKWAMDPARAGRRGRAVRPGLFQSIGGAAHARSRRTGRRTWSRCSSSTW